jgi:hypothetical protein
MMKKIFIVGCPRSGTTLLQSFLASHSKIVSFPETHLYSRTISINPIIQKVTLYRAKHIKIVEEILTDLGVQKNKEFKEFGSTFYTSEWVKFLNGQLNQIGEHFRNAEEEFLLEKTPRHLHFIDQIQGTENEAFFIHLIRNGEDVVASLSEATGNNPEEWSGERSVDKSIFWWNRSIRISQKYIGQKNNCHVRYENLVKSPEKVLRFLFDRIGLPFEDEILSNYHETANSLIGEEEVWKVKNTRETLNTSDKFNRLSPDIQDHIRKQLDDFDYQSIDINTLT